MTAEVAIINQHGIAIAADSAVTIGEDRVWKSTNKIFSLGPSHDIVIMVYGSGAFSAFPWETVVKSFKSDNELSDFGTVEDCSDAFTTFLAHDRWHDDLQSQICPLSIFAKEVSELREETISSSRAEFRSKCKATLEEWIELASENEVCISGMKKSEFIDEFSESIERLRKEEFSEHFPKYLSDLLIDYLYTYFTHSRCPSGYESGVVIAGFGKDEYQPSLVELIVDGRFEKHVRLWSARKSSFSEFGNPCQIIPFAQRDMTNLFMEGISPAYGGLIDGLISEILDSASDQILKSFHGTAEEKIVEKRIQERSTREIRSKISKLLSDFRNQYFVQPLMSNVRNLPREEMAAMAEALVELTSLRRKIDSTLQTVAGPVDVVLISKSDGVVWMKRKHYFRPEINHDFFARKIGHGA